MKWIWMKMRCQKKHDFGNSCKFLIFRIRGWMTWSPLGFEPVLITLMGRSGKGHLAVDSNSVSVCAIMRSFDLFRCPVLSPSFFRSTSVCFFSTDRSISEGDFNAGYRTRHDGRNFAKRAEREARGELTAKGHPSALCTLETAIFGGRHCR